MTLGNYLFNTRQQRQDEPGRPPAKRWQYFAKHGKVRLSGAGFISLSLHVVLFAGYLVIASFTETEMVEIQEVTFIDLTDEPQQLSLPKEEVGLGLKMAEVPKIMESVTEDAVEASAPAPDVAEISIPEPEKPKTAIQVEPAAAAVNTALAPSNLLAFSAPAGSGSDKIMVSPSKVSLDRRNNQAPSSAIRLTNSSNERGSRIALANHTAIVSPGQHLSNTGGSRSGGSSDLVLGSGSGKANITGPLANRQIVKRTMPPFPQWAKQKGVGATIALRFTVMEDGTVKENIVVERTSGSGEWDHMVIDALRKWLFAPLGEIGRRFDQNGVITFHFVIT